MNKKLKKVMIGYVGVDSGLVVIQDPCYSVSVEEALAASNGDPKGETGHNAGEHLLAVAVGSGYGDGMYKAYGHFDEDGRCMRLEVDFRLPER